MKHKKMTVEIWSDVTCTFCYTAKRKFENALSQFSNKDNIEVIWKSFELAPGLKTDAGKNLPRFLAELKGISLEQAQGMTDHVTNLVKEVGLTYHLNNAIPANSFNAHRLSHLAKDHHLQDQAEERLFKAYFTEGKNVDDLPTLIQLAAEIGLDPGEVKSTLESTGYADEVRKDLAEAQQRGVTSVPFFVFNGKTTVSGAQDSSVFLKTLEQTFTQWQLKNSEMNEGQSCSVDGNCK